MTDKQINIVEILAEQCKNCTLYEGDTISLTISIFDRPLRGVCFDNNIYFSVDELNYIIQKLISKEQECEELKIYIESNEQQVKEVETLVMDNDRLINELDQLKFDYAELEQRHNDSFEQFKQLKADNKHLNDLLNQALNEIEAIQDAYEERE